jgi:hypothetical protein
VISAATGRWDEIRHEISVGPGYDDGTRRLSAGYRRSTENDWWSHTAILSGSVDFDRHNETLSLSLSYVHNTVGRAEDANFQELLHVLGASLSLTLVASRDDLVMLTYNPSFLDGYQASPYRFVRFADASVAGLLTQPEAVPERRLRHAAAVQHNHHLLRDSALRSQARAYVDDWGVASATLGTEYVHGFGNFSPSVFARAYGQTGAHFWEDVYSRRRRFMTADRELSPFVDVFGGTRLSYRTSVGVFDELRADAKLTAFLFEFLDFSRLPRRRGLVAEIGIGGTF